MKLLTADPNAIKTRIINTARRTVVKKEIEKLIGVIYSNCYVEKNNGLFNIYLHGKKNLTELKGSISEDGRLFLQLQAENHFGLEKSCQTKNLILSVVGNNGHNDGKDFS